MPMDIHDIHGYDQSIMDISMDIHIHGKPGGWGVGHLSPPSLRYPHDFWV